MNLLEIIPGEFRRAGGKNGGEYHGPCPWCGDGGKAKKSDRFHIWPEQGRNGTYWCRMCGRSGDGIRFLVDREGLSFAEALTQLNLKREDLGAGKGKSEPPLGWRPSVATRPAEIWAEHATKFADWCHGQLLENPEQLCWLASRGITTELVAKFKLGWNPAHAWRERQAWGLKPERKDGGKFKKLWLPQGLVIPCFSTTGTLLRLRMRQPEGRPRYLVVPGSSREPLCSRSAEGMIIVESELDAILLDGLVGDLVGVVAMGNDTAKPTDTLLPLLQQAMVLLISLDSDLPRFNPETGAMDIPGAKASRWWLSQFSHAVRVPVIGGKDPGEAFQRGEDLRSWVMAALPPYFQIKADLAAEKAKQLARQGEESGDDLNPEFCPVVRTVTLKNGRSFCLVDDKGEWQRLAKEGHVVFSAYELKRMQAAFGTMNEDERLAAAMTVLDVKEVFAPAWIRRGEVIADEQPS